MLPRDHRLEQGTDAPLLASLARSARRASDGVLALCAGAGILATGALVVAGSPWPVLVPFAVLVLAFGAWGMLDRSVAERRREAAALPRAVDDDSIGRTLAALKAVVAAAGIVAAVAAVLLPLAFTLGNVVH